MMIGCSLSLLLGSGCGSSRYILSERTITASPEEALQRAREYLNGRSDWRIDCSHFVLTCYHSGKMNSYFLHRKGHKQLTYDLNAYLTLNKTRRAKAVDIRPGDILIFDKTYDINRDGHIDEKDVFTHVGIAESCNNGVLIYIDASEDRHPPRIRRRQFSFFNDRFNETVATDRATGRKIRARETFYAAYEVPKD
jgi:hypothetical protein